MSMLWLAAACLLLLVGRIIYCQVASLLNARRLGTLRPRSLPSKDHIFNLDVFLKGLRDRKAHVHLEREISRYRKLQTDTYSMKAVGRAEIHTKNEDNFKNSLSVKAHLFGVGPMRGKGMSPFCGYGFLTTDGAIWEQSRARLKPSFTRQNITDMTALDNYVSQLTQRLPLETTVDFQQMILRMFVDVSQLFIIGRAPGAFDTSKEYDGPIEPRAYLAAFSSSLISLGLRMMLGPFRFLLPARMSTDHWKKVFAYIDYFIGRAMEERALEGKASQSTAKSLLQKVSEETNDPVEIRNQVLQGLLAAQDTIATLISNVVFRLARRPDIWSRLRQEMLKYDPASVTVSSLRHKPLLRNILHEVLRMHPLFPRMARVALQSTTLPKGGGPDGSSPIYVPAGTRVIHTFAAAHRNSAMFGENVDEFDPDRWLSISPSPWQYLPFGGGQRQCLGQSKALNEASYVIWKLACTYERIEPRDEREYAPLSRLITQNAHGCRVAFFAPAGKAH